MGEELEIACAQCEGRGYHEVCCGGHVGECCGDRDRCRCGLCDGAGWYLGVPPTGSLTSARLRLADAAEKLGFIPDAMGDFEEQFNDALAALRTARGA